jgi:hypothetical protein
VLPHKCNVYGSHLFYAIFPVTDEKKQLHIPILITVNWFFRPMSANLLRSRIQFLYSMPVKSVPSNDRQPSNISSVYISCKQHFIALTNVAVFLISIFVNDFGTLS